MSGGEDFWLPGSASGFAGCLLSPFILGDGGGGGGRSEGRGAGDGPPSAAASAGAGES